MAKSKVAGKIDSKKDKKPVKVAYPSRYTTNSMIGYVAEKNGLSRSNARAILEDFFAVIGEGVMKGQRVPVGIFGKLLVKIRKAAPARKGRNPLTGEEIMIKPRPEMKVPKFSFSKAFKATVKSL